MRIHILGVCGTFMGGLALLARECGHVVTGSDANVYPPMSTQLEEQGITLMEGYDPAHISKDVDCVIVGNVIMRGNPCMEYIMNNNIPYTSGPQWLAENILAKKWVLGVSGTHGKTTTTSMLAWILEAAGKQPGFLVGGVPENFGVSARLGNSAFFVIEADEYDSAFFDKRPKFIHYRPKTTIINNLEYDHADIFPDLDAIKQQFHYLVRTVQGDGLIVCPEEDVNIRQVLAKGLWTGVATFGVCMGDWRAELVRPDGGEFVVREGGKTHGCVAWGLIGKHNVNNALAAIIAARHSGVEPSEAIEALKCFKNVKRRMEIKASLNDIVIYDDFAHHPTAISQTLDGLRAHIGKEARLIAVVEFGSYTMRSGVHKSAIKSALAAADVVLCKLPEMDWGLGDVLADFTQPASAHSSVDEVVVKLTSILQPGDRVIVMSNSGFGGFHQKLLASLDSVRIVS